MCLLKLEIVMQTHFEQEEKNIYLDLDLNMINGKKWMTKLFFQFTPIFRSVVNEYPIVLTLITMT
jgi:hypothetical protein